MWCETLGVPVFDLCVASLACTNSVNYIFHENSRKMNAKFYKIKKTALLFMQNLSLYVLSLLTIIPHPSSTFQLGSWYLACHIINMRRNRCRNSCTSGNTPPTYPAMDPWKRCAIDRWLCDRPMLALTREPSIVLICRWRTTYLFTNMAIEWPYQLLFIGWGYNADLRMFYLPVRCAASLPRGIRGRCFVCGCSDL